MNINYEEPIRFIGEETVNIDYPHGELPPAIGVNSIQVLRANRENPQEAEDTGWTYNHSPMLSYHNGKIYLEYLSNEIEEHVPPGHTLLTVSKDGMHWSKPKVIFPVYKVPDGLFEYDGKKLPDNTYAVMHQRMGYYLAPNGKFLVLANYGISPSFDQVPFGRFSIGRVVREIYPDDSLGPIFFIRYNKNTIWNESNTSYPIYTRSEDVKFIEACEQLMADPLVTQQWAEEQGDDDELVTVKSRDGGAFYNKAFCRYRLPDRTVIGLWKWMKAAVSHDEGKSWSKVALTPTITHGGSKIWGQKTSDNRYALVYNPHTNNGIRWPLAVVTGSDGLTFDKMMHVISDISPKRYVGGPFKRPGFNYFRGIETNEGVGPDGAMYVAYSVNKEDIWISRLQVPITGTVEQDVHEDFSSMQEDSWIEGWNVYSPKWAPVKIASSPDGAGKCLMLEDFDPHEYAKAEKVFPEGVNVEVSLRIMAPQNDKGSLYIELCNNKGRTPFKVIFGDNGELIIHHGRNHQKFANYEAGRWYDVKIVADTKNHMFNVELDGKSLGSNQIYQGQSTGMNGWFFEAPVKTLDRIVFRTGPVRRELDLDYLWTDDCDLQHAGEKTDAFKYYIKSLDTASKL